MKYFAWLYERNPDVAWIDKFPDEIGAKDYLLDKGLRAKEWFPAGIAFDMSEQSSRRLLDILPNVLGLQLISETVKMLLEEHAQVELEFLPIRIRNHKKRIEEKPYYILNVLDPVFCMDLEKSDYVTDSLDKTQMFTISHLHFDENKLPKDRKLFRLGEKNTLFIIREDLADKLSESGCTGLNFVPQTDYGAQYRKISMQDRIAKLKAQRGPM